jgi:hypothetical protein
MHDDDDDDDSAMKNSNTLFQRLQQMLIISFLDFHLDEMQPESYRLISMNNIACM